eukprot:TRINITY_DN4610_c0_g2_i1.p1 TRINITY_DN4610_c0_g2~~TRINITY_DN4610_c0_g2_i1.p1  ORF type:complete len:703 (+),score=124.08 TRINITY_DN4610_c0_g2_i1:98-2206(+)
MDPDSVIGDKNLQDSENSSKFSSDSSSETSDAAVFTVVLRQKPRGSGGIWQAVQTSEHLRVSDKRAGKNLRLVLTSHQQNIDWASVAVHLLSKPTRVTNSNISVADVWQTHDESNDFFKISERKTFFTGMESSRRSVCQIDLKLFLMYRTIKFSVSVQRPDSDDAEARLHADSVTFISYNSGTEETNRQSKASRGSTTKRKRDSKKKAKPKAEKLYPASDPKETKSLAASPKSDEMDQDSLQTIKETIDAELDATWTAIDRNLEVEGIVRAQRFAQLSDVRLKVDVRQLSDALRIVSQLDGKSYQWRADDQQESKYSKKRPTTITAAAPGERVLGFIAQEIQRVCPEVVQEDPQTGMLSVSYAELVPMLIEALKTIQAESARFEDKIAEDMKEIAQMRDDFMSASKRIRSTLRRIGRIRESRPISPPTPNISRNKKRAALRCCATKVCGLSLANVFLGFGLFASFVAIILIASLAGTNNNPPAQSPQAMSPTMPSKKIPWSSMNWLGGGGFESGEGAQTVGDKLLEIHRYSNFSEFPEVNNASLYFNAGDAAARLFIDPNNTGIYDPEAVRYGVYVEGVLLNYTGFSNASSGVLGMNITGWFNWIYAEEPLGFSFVGRTTERIFLEVNAYFPDSVEYADKTDLFYAPNIMPEAYRGWSKMSFIYRFEEERYPKFVSFAFSTTMRGSVFFDGLESNFLIKPVP